VTPLTESTGRGQGTPRWSPDGRWIAYDATGEDAVPHIYLVNADGGPSRRLTQWASVEQVPSWSRDGTSVYFVSNRAGRSDVYRMPVAGGEPTQMTGNTRQHGCAWESWDATILYFKAGDALIAKSLPNGPETQILTSVRRCDYFPAKEGIYHVVVPDPQARPFAYELRLFDVAKGTSRVLNRFEALEGRGGLSVSPDGKTVLYSGEKTSGGEDLMMIQHYR
jgi:hypothetical protein